ncbi:hypothetical protein CONPUDRAFT_154154 [Coniophora puteana RWD-64-598 SS2]|uniref:DRBM domain-containing protein n=1 Tax=Coniophora puteana (strain RWD-64-598) TaxID=741705 RepID=A0A5M3MSA0_CONPW|nr:uncharacterized protein CONPUDRAFT_154154 [Coniophora puteana RWD-64-598 SS2]EIW81624.1 hypothetical protein CONPUDRAFT_154154 [Coniophora puteana RWD-64-598 SS2]
MAEKKLPLHQAQNTGMPNGQHNKMDLNNFLQSLPNGSLLKASGASWGMAEKGPDHDRIWRATLTIAGRTWHGEARTKRDAEDVAAAEALAALKNQ